MYYFNTNSESAGARLNQRRQPASFVSFRPDACCFRRFDQGW
jgi:hypothetical protein